MIYQTLEDIVLDFRSCPNPKAFAQGLKHKKSLRYMSLVKVLVDNDLFDEYDGKWTKLVYDIEHPTHQLVMCELCHASPVFWIQVSRCYSRWCSAVCSRKDYRRVPHESTKISVRKRREAIEYKKKYAPEKLIETGLKIKRAFEKFSKTPEYQLYREKASIRMKKRISAGTLTPNISNGWTHWKILVSGKKFRSSFEAIFWLYNQKSYQFETLRIPYHFNGCDRTYIVDFVNHQTNHCVVIKTSSKVDYDIKIAKMEALTKWCNDNSYTISIITEHDIKQMCYEMSNIEHDPFVDEVIRKYKWT